MARWTSRSRGDEMADLPCDEDLGVVCQCANSPALKLAAKRSTNFLQIQFRFNSDSIQIQFRF
ncbi:hypothetical protein ACN38_g10534, partial [Penicillium nordicum]